MRISRFTGRKRECEAVSKTVVGLRVYRGFESHPLRFVGRNPCYEWDFVLAEVTAAGATVKEPAHDVGGGRLVATVTDPDGNVSGTRAGECRPPLPRSALSRRGRLPFSGSQGVWAAQLGVATPAESVTMVSRQLAHHQVV
jgi:NADPH-dependent glutamate synthase beta subunit-like oxidoreductase